MLEWLQENYATLTTVALSLYAAARAIVALTPTPKDDKALQDVSIWLKTLAKIFGLDLKQGITKKTETKPYALSDKIVPFLLISLMLCSGCAAFKKSPSFQYAAAETAFQESVEVLIILRDQDKFNDRELKVITDSINVCDNLLQLWNDEVTEGKEVTVVKAFNASFSVLTDYILIKESE